MAANARAAKLTEKDPLRKQLQSLLPECDALRSKIVATKEGGMITGEERIRELLGQLYGAVTGYDGKPTDYQVARTESLGHELQDVIDDFQKLTAKRTGGHQCGAEKEEAGSYHRSGRGRLAEEAGWICGRGRRRNAGDRKSDAGDGLELGVAPTLTLIRFSSLPDPAWRFETCESVRRGRPPA